MTVQMIAFAALFAAVLFYFLWRQLRSRAAEPVAAGVSDGSLPGRRRSGTALVYAAPDPEPQHFQPRDRASAAALGLSPEPLPGSEHDYYEVEEPFAEEPEAPAAWAVEDEAEGVAAEDQPVTYDHSGANYDEEEYDEEVGEEAGTAYASLTDHAPVFRHSVGFVEDDEVEEEAFEPESGFEAPEEGRPGDALIPPAGLVVLPEPPPYQSEPDDEGLPRIRAAHPGPDGSRFDAVNATIGQTWSAGGDAALVWVERAALRVHEVCGWIGHSGFDGYFNHVADPNHWDEAIEGLRIMGQDEAAALIEQAGEAWWPHRETGDYPSGMFDPFDAAWNALALDDRALLEAWLEDNYPWA